MFLWLESFYVIVSFDPNMGDPRWARTVGNAPVHIHNEASIIEGRSVHVLSEVISSDGFSYGK